MPSMEQGSFPITEMAETYGLGTRKVALIIALPLSR